METGFSEEQAKRYARHLVLKEIGADGQGKLMEACVLIIGAGGLGSPAALYLAAAGIGTIGIADSDIVDLSNLQRQIIHTVNDIDRAKVSSAANKIKALNPGIKINIYNMDINRYNIPGIIKNYDFIIDATDNFTSKFLINDACVKEGKAFSHAGVTRFQGQLLTYVPGEGPCYRCLFKNPPPEDAVPGNKDVGIMGAACGVIGSLQALEAIKYITGSGALLTGRLLVFDGLKMQFRTVKFNRDSNCTACAGFKADKL